MIWTPFRFGSDANIADDSQPLQTLTAAEIEIRGLLQGISSVPGPVRQATKEQEAETLEAGELPRLSGLEACSAGMGAREQGGGAGGT